VFLIASPSLDKTVMFIILYAVAPLNVFGHVKKKTFKSKCDLVMFSSEPALSLVS